MTGVSDPPGTLSHIGRESLTGGHKSHSNNKCHWNSDDRREVDTEISEEIHSLKSEKEERKVCESRETEQSPWF